MRVLLFICFFLPASFACAQYNATIQGKIIDENEAPLGQVSIVLLGKEKGISSDESGAFSMKVTAEKAFALTFSHVGYKTVQKNFLLNKGKTETVTVRLIKSDAFIDAVIVNDEKERKESGLVRLNPKNAILLPSTSGGVEGLIKTLVGSNNELTSQYNVRGGNYDENIVYINDFEVFRPYLVSNGQQEGLSFINPEMVRNINFYSGGFQARYGDKMSSVLEIQYLKPTRFGGSTYMSLLEQGFSLYGNLKKDKASFVLGCRNKNNRNVLSNQPTTGAYIPSASDFQGLLTYKLSANVRLELLTIFSGSRFTFYPESVKKTASVFSPFFTSNLGLDTYFDGLEKDRYKTGMVGATLIHNPTKKLKLKWLLQRFRDEEYENYDISGAYLFGERDFDNSSSTFGQIINPLGAGVYQQYARNRLLIDVWNAGHRGSAELHKHFLQWGTNIERTSITDLIRQFEYQDSAGYSLPYNTSALSVSGYVNSAAQLTISKYSGFIQDNFHVAGKSGDMTFQTGLRVNFNDLNREWILSPRVQSSWKPVWKKDVVFRAAAGIYCQPPFYRELRKYDGTLNTSVRSQKSLQFTGGMDYQFKGGDRPFRMSAEAYYKSMWDVIPYDIDNVKIKYLGSNNAKAYATGLEFRLFSELIKDAESWISLGFMRTRENLSDDYYYDYLNASGEVITSQSTDQTAVDSVKQSIGSLRRPSDRLITAGLFLQDYLATNKNFKVHLNIIYGSNMPYNIPNSSRYRNGLIIDPYIRADVGFSALLLGEESVRRSHSPFRNIKNIWASLEIFNLINKTNTISFQLIKDFANNTYAIPNTLTPRLLNFKVIARF